MKNKRILIKISGQSFKNNVSNFDFCFLRILAKQIIEINDQNKEVVVIVGGGNLCRGEEIKNFFLLNINKDPFDYAGMLATVINGIILKEIIIEEKGKADLLSIIKIKTDFTKEYSIDESNKILSENKILILTGGIGIPGYSTDSLITKISNELKIKLVLVGKNGVKGVYSSDPSIDQNSKFIYKIKFKDIIQNNLKIIDISSAKEAVKIKDFQMIIFNIKEKKSILNAFNKKGVFTNVKN